MEVILLAELTSSKDTFSLFPSHPSNRTICFADCRHQLLLQPKPLFEQHEASTSMVYVSVADDYRQSRVQPAIYRALRDGEYEKLPDFDPALLWEPNAINGWTAIHYAASHPLMPLKWWKWILERAGSKDMLSFRTALGETVVDIFFQAQLQPLPWQYRSVHRRSQELREALESRDDIEAARRVIQGDSKELLPSRASLLVDFWRAMETLGRAVTSEWMRFLAYSGSCPALVWRWLLQMNPPSNLLLDWADSTLVRPRDETCEELVRRDPSAASVMVEGRYPLHSALVNGRTLESIMPLVFAAPSVLAARDPISGLPCFALPAIGAVEEKEALYRARRSAAGSSSVVHWTCLSRQQKKVALRLALLQIEADSLSTVYQLLRFNPTVLHHSL